MECQAGRVERTNVNFPAGRPNFSGRPDFRDFGLPQKNWEQTGGSSAEFLRVVRFHRQEGRRAGLDAESRKVRETQLRIRGGGSGSTSRKASSSSILTKNDDTPSSAILPPNANERPGPVSFSRRRGAVFVCPFVFDLRLPVRTQPRVDSPVKCGTITCPTRQCRKKVESRNSAVNTANPAVPHPS